MAVGRHFREVAPEPAGETDLVYLSTCDGSTQSRAETVQESKVPSPVSCLVDLVAKSDWLALLVGIAKLGQSKRECRLPKLQI